MKFGRRDLVKFVTGGVCGAALTPVPWKLLEDSANWSQNWPGIPNVPRGERTVRFSACTLCPAGCGVKAQCVAGRAVGLEGASGHPASRGTLCPAGIAAHTAACHPQRLRQPLKGKTPVTAASAVSEIARRIAAGQRVAILDLGPERAASAYYRDAAECFGNGLYARMADRQEATLNAVAPLVGRNPGTLGFDLERTRTLVSFGAPIVQRWATPGLVLDRWRSGGLRIIQVEPRLSRTSMAAEAWIPVEPGGEAAVALRIARGEAPEVRIEAPAIAVGAGGDEEPAVAALNLVLGAVGRPGGIVERAPGPWKQEKPAPIVEGLPDQWIGVLIVDASRASGVTPWPVIRRALADGALVVALAWREDGITEHADIALPVAAPFECADDTGTAPCAAVPSFSVAPALIDTPAVSRTPADYLAAVLRALGKTPPGATVEDRRKERAVAIHAAGKGTVVSYADGSRTPVDSFASPEELLKKMAEGACWTGEMAEGKLVASEGVMPPLPPRPSRDEHRPFTLLAYESPGDASPLMTKLYQESGLYILPELARMNPETAARIGVKTGSRVVIDTAYGASWRTALVDLAVMPGTVEVASSRASGDITDVATNGASNWRVTAADVRKA